MMAEVTQYSFSHKEIVELLIKKQGIHEGQWSILIAVGSAALNLGPTADQINPTVLIAFQKIGIQRMPEGLPPDNNITVDAAKVNPAKPAAKTKKMAKA